MFYVLKIFLLQAFSILWHRLLPACRQAGVTHFNILNSVEQ
jgi:hypothetical protein